MNKLKENEKLAEAVNQFGFIILISFIMIYGPLLFLIMIIVYWQTGHLNDGLFDLISSIK